MKMASGMMENLNLAVLIKIKRVKLHFLGKITEHDDGIVLFCQYLIIAQHKSTNS